MGFLLGMTLALHLAADLVLGGTFTAAFITDKVTKGKHRAAHVEVVEYQAP